jgi:hypothetical protein
MPAEPPSTPPIIKVATDVPARVRLYDTAAHQAADVGRAVGTDPASGAGVVLDVVTVGGALTVPLSPEADGSSLETVPSANIPLTVNATNAGTVTATLTWLQTEA